MAIERLSGVVVDPDSTDFLIRALELLAELLAARGGAAAPRLLEVTEQLKTGVNSGAARSKSGADTIFVDGEADSAHTPWHAFLNTQRAADILGITPNGVRDLARRGSLPARRVGREWIFDAAAVIRRAAHSGR